MLTEQEILQEKQQLNEVAPLLAFLFGIFAKAGYDRVQAQRAAQAAAAAADQAAPGAADAVTQQGQPNPNRPGFILNGTERVTRGPAVTALQTQLGIQADGVYGPNTTAAVKQFQQQNGLQVDGIVGPNTQEKLRQVGASRVRPQPRPQVPGQPATADAAGATVMASKENKGNQINEEVTISGSVDDLLRMMQLAGANGAKAVDADDISSGPKPCPMCGKVHGESPCGDRNGDLARSIELIASEENDYDGDVFDDEPSSSDDVEYYSADTMMTPPTNDINKKKKTYPATPRGDNPMALEDQIKQRLQAAFESKKKEVDEAHGNSKVYDKCWTGYRKVKGKKRGEKGSCKKI